ncbi:hypothetical protein P152DRAFT_479691 [Eremomyces bilateralis CBS 781.70]|uniref:Cora-domain-containing protein n=1 Tax=Eremomyces bilateralis CBS 781.70 TaxID=1392243 RepID=A0A6G1GCK9_9PEZI|nr:uncharacterized protein P152DRAFT_479691 [Eremomyces bilateralis CBS 781.70]KAF1815828.1 hypothetical protein P152DRAFT_479691 [Eremomyces bilateralis CBS 781.70]
MDPEDIALPESESVEDIALSSLDELLLHSDSYNRTAADALSASGGSIVLPPSTAASVASSLIVLEESERKREHTRLITTLQRHHDEYVLSIWSRLSSLPRLDALIRNPVQGVTLDHILRCHDFTAQGRSRRVSLKGLFEAPQTVARDVVMRVVTMEDMDVLLASALGQAYHIDPKFFEAHLTGSGCGERIDEEDNKFAVKWQSGKAHRSFRSIRWLRPVSPQLFIDRNMRRQIIKKSTPELPCIIGPCSKKKHQVWTEKSVFRRAQNLSSSVDLTETEDATGAWEERLSVWRFMDKDCEFYVVLVDPLPAIRYKVKLEVRDKSAPKQLLMGKRPSRHASKFAAGEDEKRGFSKQKTLQEIADNDHGDPGDIIPFRSRSIRSDLDFHLDDFVPDTTRTATSTLAAFEALVAKETQEGKKPDIGHIFFHILYHDSLALGQAMRGSLEETRAQIVHITSYELQQNSLRWRTLFFQFHYELQHMAEQMTDLLDFLYRDHSQVPERTKRLCDDGKKLLNETSDKVDRTNDYLRVELDILERRRSIEQAESVAKLTELAFIFIPLTYAASLFSMQIREVQDSTPTLSIFVGVSLGLLCTAYVVRLSLRSKITLSVLDRFVKNVRGFANLPEGAAVPTRYFLHWFLHMLQNIFNWLMFGPHHLGECFSFGVIVLALLVPLIFFWRMQHDVGFSVAITVLMLMMDVGLLWPVFKFLMPSLSERLANFFELTEVDRPKVVYSSHYKRNAWVINRPQGQQQAQRRKRFFTSVQDA